MRRAGMVAGVLALALAAAWFGGCADLRGTVAPNRPPETTLWIQGDLDTVKHTVHVFWDGQDADGIVTGFEFKWIYQPGAEPAGYDSSVWFFTPKRDSLFTVFAPTGVNFPTFAVRAIDDQGERDPTPARQLFKLSNQVGSVRFTVTPADTTFPVATFDWAATDPDGNVANARYRVWLKGKEAEAQVIAGRQYTFLPASFRDGAGQFILGRHTAYVALIDDGGLMSPPDSFHWNVRLPVGNTLLVDDVPSTVPSASVFDAFYRGELNARLGAGTYSILNLETGSPFRSRADVRETFGFFQHVFWYSETNASFSVPLSLADEGIRTHLSAGRNLFLTNVRLVGTGGVLGETFRQEVLGASALRMNTSTGTTNFTLANGRLLVGGSAPFDSLRAVAIVAGIESFILNNPADAAYLAPPMELDTLHTEAWPVAVSRRFGTGQGRLVYLAFPLRLLNGSVSGQPRSAIELRKVFTLFGMPGGS